MQPPHNTACSPNKSVSVSSSKVVSRTPARVPPIPAAYANAKSFALPEKFKLISNTETRFMQWFSIVIDDVVKRYYSGGRTVNYYQINQDQIDALGGNQIVVNHLAAIRKRKNLTQSQFALIKAFENPNLMFDPISGRQISESEL